MLITRPAVDADETAALVAARGFDPVIAPVLRLHPRSIAPGGTFDAVVVTSRNAIPALPDDLRPVPLLAVGGATAARARAAGFRTVLDADGDGEALTRLASRQLRPGSRVLFAHGERQGDAVAETLIAGGLEVVRMIAYAVLPAPCLPDTGAAALRAETLHAATFLSAETAAAFVDLLPPRLAPTLRGIVAIAIGARTADVLAPLSWREVRVAFKPTLDDVLALL